MYRVPMKASPIAPGARVIRRSASRLPRAASEISSSAPKQYTSPAASSAHVSAPRATSARMAVEGGGPSKGYGDGVALGVTAGLCGGVALGEIGGGGAAVVGCGSGPVEHPIHTIDPTIDTRPHANRAIAAKDNSDGWSALD
jgi:hypothetical protein